LSHAPSLLNILEAVVFESKVHFPEYQEMVTCHTPATDEGHFYFRTLFSGCVSYVNSGLKHVSKEEMYKIEARWFI
jgi:hypothetical protein